MNTPHASPALDADTLRFLQQVFQWVRAGQADLLAPALQAGLPSNLLNEKGDSLLLLAAYHGHREVAGLLLEAGADTELANDRGQTALGAAAFRGDVELVRLLLDRGAQVDGPPGGRTAFIIAAMFNRLDIMHLLRERGADLSARDEGGLDALLAAEKMGAMEAKALLRQWADEPGQPAH